MLLLLLLELFVVEDGGSREGRVVELGVKVLVAGEEEGVEVGHQVASEDHLGALKGRLRATAELVLRRNLERLPLHLCFLLLHLLFPSRRLHHLVQLSE